MNVRLLITRIHKLTVSITRPFCWKALSKGVAPSAEHLSVLRRLKVDGILDVGANRGQFSLACRIALPSIPIVAFEPIVSEARLFKFVHENQSQIDIVEVALGDTTTEAKLHLSESADSSSMLPIGTNQTALFKNTKEVGNLTVQVRRLDDFATHWKGRRRQLLKIDVQGYELQVLQGAKSTLMECAFVYVECSEIELYRGQALRTDVEAFLLSQGFSVLSRHNCFYSSGSLIQADYLFARSSPDASNETN